MRRPILLWSLALGAAVLWGVQRARTGRPQRGDSAGATTSASKTTADATGRGAGAKQQQPLNVSAVRAVPAPFTEHISATGTLRAEEGVELQAETGGRLRSINFTEGSRVKKGDLLIKLTDDDLQAMLVRASSRLNLAVQRRSRIERLFRDGVANQEDYDSAVNEMAVQEAEVGVIRAQIAKTEIRAPFDAVVGLRFISEGAFVNANSRMATLQAVDRLKLDFSVPERFAERIAPGTVVEFSAGGRARRQGKVSAVEPRLDAGTRTLTARAVIANPDGLLRPGSFVSVDVTLETFPDAIVLPSVSVVPGPTERSVFVVSDGRAVRRAVQTGTRTESTVHIVSGVQPGDLVITSGLQQMRQGLPVNPIMADLKQQETQGPNSATPKPAQAAAAARENPPLDMSLAELSIRRPVLTLVISLLITLAGGLSLARMGVREYPAVDPPTITIVTSYPGASSEVVQAQITEPIEEAVNAVSGIRNLTSTSREGVSQITVEFTLDTDLDTAASDVRDQLSRAARNLPPDSNPPILNKANADSSPLLGIAIRSELRSQLELSGFADTLRERLQTVPGIAQVDQPAEKRYAMRLWMDAEKLAGHGLTPSEVRRALARENVELPSGRVEGESMELPIKTLGRLNTPSDFDAMILRSDGDSIVRFGDVGYAELGPQNERGALKSDGRPIAGLYFRPQPGANQIEIVDALRARIDRIRKELPSDIQLEVAYDNTSYVRRSLLEVTETIFIAFGLVALVVFAFFREWRTTLIPVLAIPVSIIGTFAIMAACGFSINTLTLLGIVLAIGLVVDDAIVVLENIYKRIEHGERPMAAAIAGTEQIFTAVISTTMTLAVVFLPLLFMGGLSGRLFREFAVTISGAVLISAVVALTLTPMLSARMLSASVGGGWLFRRTEGFFEALESGYRLALGRFLAWRWLSVIILGLAAWSSYTVYQRLPRELSPLEDRGRLWLRATAPEGVSYEHMQSLADELTLVAAERVPEATLMMTQVPGSGGAQGVQGAINSGFVRVFLSDKSERKRSQQEIAAALQPVQRELTGARINITQEASIGERRAGQSGIQFVIQAPELADLRRVLPKFLEEARKNTSFTFVDSDLKFDKPEITVSIDRDKARALGLSARDIAEAVQASLSGQRMGFFLHQGKQYEVIGQMIRQFRSKPGDLSGISLRTPEGDMVQLANLVNLRESSSPPELYRFNRYSSATISATLARGVAMGDGIAALQAAAKSTLDEKFTTSLTGAAQDFVESSSSLGYVFILAILLIYLVLGAQFESFLHPLVILLTVPLALCGALLALWWFDQTLNIFSQIGLIMLIGLVTKNGILIVEFANQRLEAGAPTPLDAIREAAPARLRPILMTTLATILGILPIALALGAGAESRMSMGIAVIGGLVVGGALTLFVIPAMFLLFSRKRLPQAGEAIDAGITPAAAARA